MGSTASGRDVAASSSLGMVAALVIDPAHAVLIGSGAVFTEPVS